MNLPQRLCHDAALFTCCIRRDISYRKKYRLIGWCAQYRIAQEVGVMEKPESQCQVVGGMKAQNIDSVMVK